MSTVPSNRISGVLPTELGSLTNLESLNVNNNEFSGVVSTLSDLTDTFTQVNLTGNDCFSTGELVLAAWLDENNPGWDQGYL